jgi:preprotein translocase subunit SecD
MVAMVVDNKIICAPAIQAVLSTQAAIAGEFDEAGAELLASRLRYLPLPVALEIASVTSIR